MYWTGFLTLVSINSFFQSTKISQSVLRNIQYMTVSDLINIKCLRKIEPFKVRAFNSSINNFFQSTKDS